MRRLRQFPLGRFLRFGIVGFSGVFVDLAVTYLLIEYAHWPRYLSNNVAIEAAIVNNFLWNDAWTFADVSERQKGWHARLKRFAKFNLVCLTGAVLQNVILTLVLLVPITSALPEILDGLTTADWTENAGFYFAKVVAIALVTFWNFWVNLKLSWRQSR